MPQKRNPVDATLALAAARLAVGVVPVVLRAMAQEHERAAGGWQAEWAALPELFRWTAGAVERVRDAVGGLDVQVEQMRANLANSNGQILAEALTAALASRLGRHAAYRLVREASARARTAGTGLREAALADPQVRDTLPAAELDHIFDPVNYLGSTDTYIQRALDEFRALRSRAEGGMPYGSQH